MPSTHEELLRRYVKAADAGNWFLARQIGNSAGCGLATEESTREDFDRVPAGGVRALRSTRLPAGRAGTFRLPRWAA